MPAPVSDDAFARVALQMGAVTAEQIEAARKLQSDRAQQGAQLSLGEALVQQGVLTAALRQNIEKRLGPRIIGPYQLLGKIGEGAMGAVYRAKVVKTGIEVALKILPRKFSEDQSYIARFLREAKAGLELEHEHVVRTVDFGDHEGVYFIALELVQGGDLNKKLKTLKLLPEPDALRVIHEVTLGLQHAHEKGLVHRDIKPGNIMFTKDGKAKLSDFGLVKYTDPEASHLTQTGMAVGTPHYIAPEQATGEKDVDIRADIYSLGATLYHLVTGRPPYEGSSVGEVIMKHLTAQLTPPDEIVPGLSDGCVALIEKMMAKAREDRYATPAELLADLERVQRGELPTALIEVGRSSVAVSTQRMERLKLPKPVRVLEVQQPPADLRNQLGMAPEEKPAPRPPGRRRTGGPHAPVAGRGAPRTGRTADAQRAAGEKTGVDESKRSKPVWVVSGVAAGLVILGLVAFFFTRGPQPGTSKPDTRVASAGDEYPSAMAAAYRELEGEKTADGCFYELSAEKRKKVEAALAKALSAKPGDAAATELRAKLDMPKGLALDLGDGVKMEFVLIPAGVFMMGDETIPDARPVHKVRITRPFYMGKYEVTQAQYEKVTGSNPSTFKGVNLPVEQVSWVDARKWCERSAACQLATQKRTVRLPTEAEWEYACRAGTITEYNTGQGEGALRDAGWYTGNSAPKTHPVGQKKPNAWGLYDMHGNVWEWVEDIYGRDYYNESPPADPPGPEVGGDHVMRGGAWTLVQRECRSAFRYRYFGGTKTHDYGFRAVVEPSFGTFSGGAGTQAVAASLKPETAAWPLHDGKEPIADYAKRVGLPPTETLDLGDLVKMEFVLVPAGEFMMGSPDDEPGRESGREGPQHEVTITKPFYMGKYEVTVAQFRRFVEMTKHVTEAEKAGNKGWGWDNDWKELSNVNWKQPNFPQEENHPVCLISWNDAQAFVSWAAKATGKTVRLPTEAEWEYACRAKTTTHFYTGDDDKALDKAGWFDQNSGRKTHPVGQKAANALGLYDMHGNVWEWCEDRVQKDYYKDSPRTDPPGPTVGNDRVLRGGSWVNCPAHCRSARRYWFLPTLRGSTFGGFRLVVVAGAVGSAPAIAAQPGAEKGVTDAWIKSVQALPAEEQVRKVVEKLKELNPGYDGNEKHRVEDGQVTRFELRSGMITDISPICSLKSLQWLVIEGVWPAFAKIRDLSPVRNLPLKTLKLTCADADLSPIEGMAILELGIECTNITDFSFVRRLPQLQKLALTACRGRDVSFLKATSIKELDVGFTEVSDLSPIAELSLTRLVCSCPKVTDLRPLKRMPLTSLRVTGIGITDFSPLRDMQLKDLVCDFRPERDAAILRSIKTLENINWMTVAEFWKKYPEAGTAKPDAGSVDDPARWKDAVNLLALVDPQKDSVGGKWSARNGELVFTTDVKDVSAGLHIPYEPPEQYDYRLCFNQEWDGLTKWFAIHHGGRKFNWAASGDSCGFDPVQGALMSDAQNPTGARVSLRAGPLRTVVIQVRSNLLRVYLDSRLISEWKTDYSNVGETIPEADKGRLGVNSNVLRLLKFSRLEILEVTGKGTFTRPDDPAAKEAKRKQDEVWAAREKAGAAKAP